jgi:hypothetical protein
VMTFVQAQFGAARETLQVMVSSKFSVVTRGSIFMFHQNYSIASIYWEAVRP